MAVVTEKKSRTIQNWDQFWKKWVIVIPHSKIIHISQFHLPGLCFCLWPAGPALCCGQSCAAWEAPSSLTPVADTDHVSHLATKKSGEEFSSPVSPRRLRIFMCVFDAEVLSVFSRVDALKSWLQLEGCLCRWLYLAVVLTGAGAVKMQLSLESWVWDACPHIHAAVSVCPVGCTASPCLSSGALSYAVITPPDGTADILLAIPENSLFRLVFRALI